MCTVLVVLWWPVYSSGDVVVLCVYSSGDVVVSCVYSIGGVVVACVQ